MKNQDLFNPNSAQTECCQSAGAGKITKSIFIRAVLPDAQTQATSLIANICVQPFWMQWGFKTTLNIHKKNSTIRLFRFAGFSPQSKWDMFRCINPVDFLDLASKFESLGLREPFNDLMIFDALVYNIDRHMNNYGFLVDNDTFKIEGMAPIFDNGCGLLPYYTLDKNIDEYAKKHDYQNMGIENNDVLFIC